MPYGTPIGVCLLQTIRSMFKFVKFFKEACMPYGTPISVCLLQTIRSTFKFFKFFTYQGRLSAIQHTYICVSITDSQTDIFFLNFLLLKEACVLYGKHIIVYQSLTIRSMVFLKICFLSRKPVCHMAYLHMCVFITDS